MRTKNRDRLDAYVIGDADLATNDDGIFYDGTAREPGLRGDHNVFADLHQVGADTVLTLDANHVVTITNTALASLTTANFHLV